MVQRGSSSRGYGLPLAVLYVNVQVHLELTGAICHLVACGPDPLAVAAVAKTSSKSLGLDRQAFPSVRSHPQAAAEWAWLLSLMCWTDLGLRLHKLKHAWCTTYLSKVDARWYSRESCKS